MIIPPTTATTTSDPSPSRSFSTNMHECIHSQPTPPLSTAPASNPPSSSNTHPMTTHSQIGSLRPRRILNLSVMTDVSPIPRSTAQAMCDVNWKSSMDSEISALNHNHMWDLVPKPPNANIVGCRWLYRHKFDSYDKLDC